MYVITAADSLTRPLCSDQVVLTADVAFTALTLFEILRMPVLPGTSNQHTSLGVLYQLVHNFEFRVTQMIMMPNIVGAMVTAHTAVGRVAGFLDSVHHPELQFSTPAHARHPG